MRKPIRLLAVVPQDWLAVVMAGVRGLHIEVETAVNRQSTIGLVKLRPEIDVVLTASILPDGTWLDLQNDLSKLRRPPQVIVGARFGDVSLWCDVLESGAYDLVAYPFAPGELHRMLLGAYALHRLQRRRSEPKRCRTEG